MTKNTAAELTVLTTQGVRAVKTYTKTAKGVDVEGYGRAKNFTAETIDVDDRGKWLRRLRDQRNSFVVLGAPKDWKRGERKRRLSSTRDDSEATIEDVPRGWMPIDIDAIDFTPFSEIDDGEGFALELLDRLKLRDVRCVWHLTNSHGFFDRYRARLWIELVTPMTAAQMKAYAKERWGEERVEVDGKQKAIVDLAVYQCQQPIYTGDPVLVGVDDPVTRRVGFIDGDALDAKPPTIAARSRNKGGDDPNIAKLKAAGIYIDRLKPGQHMIECPWEDEHSGEARDDDTFYFQPHFNGHDIPAFKCHHGSCEDIGWDEVAQRYGFHFEPVGDDTHDEDVCDVAGSFSRIIASELVIVRASDVEIEAIEWLWPNRIPKGKISLIAGHPGDGKSQTTCDIAARVTTGAKWPIEGEGRAPIGSVLMLSAEDAAKDTVVPRLTAAGADLDRVYIIEAVKVETEKHERGFSLAADVARLEQKLDEIGDVALVVIDPITAYGGVGKMDWNSAGDVRGFLKPLSDLAARHNAAIVIVHHLKKEVSQGRAQLAISGSVGMPAAARSAWVVVRDSGLPDRRLFLSAKNNLAKEQKGLAYEIQSTFVESPHGDKVATSHVRWEPHVVEITAEEAMQPDDDRRQARHEAGEWLRALLTKKPMSWDDIMQSAKPAGFSEATMRRARGDVGAVIQREGFGAKAVYLWEIPK